MGKRKRSVFLWLKRPKKMKVVHSQYKRSNTIQRTPCKTPTRTPSKMFPTCCATFKRNLTPVSSHKKASRKKLKLLTSPSPCKKQTLVIEENILFDEASETLTPEMKEYMEIATDMEVATILASAGLLFYLTIFFNLIKKRKYPLTNIAFRLWLETVRWFSCASVNTMWYWNETKAFWRAGYRLFHGKFLSFMAGPRFEGQILTKETKRTLLQPDSSAINFAVPARCVLLDGAGSIPNYIKPGLMHEVLRTVESSDFSKMNMLCVDGKKVTSGLDGEHGDVDMFGFDNSPTVEENRTRLEKEVALICDINSMVASIDAKRDLERRQLFSIVDMMKVLIYFVTIRLKESRTLQKKQEYGLQQLKERAGQDWKTSKFVFAISGIQAFLYRVRQFLETALRNVGKLCQIGSELNLTSHNFCVADEANPKSQTNMFQLKDVDCQDQPLPTRLIKQRSDMWHTVRASAPVTGSSIHSAIGLRSLKEQKAHFDKKIKGLEMPVTDEVKKYFEHGVMNEPNAVATMVGKFLPMFCPQLCYVEEGCYLLSGSQKDILIEVSPDGSLRLSNTSTMDDAICVSAVEIKCPFPKERRENIYYEIPSYYVCQCLSEMYALSVKQLLFVCYTKESSTFFELDFDEDLWQSIKTEIDDLYGNDEPLRPKKLKQITRELKLKIKNYCDSKVRLLAEIPSIRMSNENNNDVYTETAYYRTTRKSKEIREIEEILSDLRMALDESETVLRTGHQLSRRKANEVMVWVISNKDRSWSSELPNSMPIAFGLKDYKFTSDQLRKASNYVLQECMKYGLKIPLLAFDGQWYGLLVRDSAGKPLTKIQFQKDVWGLITKMKKKEIIDKLKQLNCVTLRPDKESIEGISVIQKSGTLTVSSTGHAFQTVRTRTAQKYWLRKPDDSERGENQTEIFMDTPETKSVTYDWIPDDIMAIISSSGDDELISAVNSIGNEIEELVRNQHSQCEENPEGDGIVMPLNDLFEDESDSTNHSESLNTEHYIIGQTVDNPGQTDESNNHEENESNSIADNLDQSSSFRRDKVTVVENSINDRYTLQEKDYSHILSSLRESKRSEKWKKFSLIELSQMLKNAEGLASFIRAELDLITGIIQQNVNFNYNKTWTKDKKINAISQSIGDCSKAVPKKRKRTFQVPFLKTLAERILRSRKVPKSVLNIAYAQYLFPSELEKWKNERVVTSKIKTTERDIDIDWYSYPEVNPATDELLCKCIDSHHLLTNLRIRTSTVGLQNISPKAWKEVARSYKTKLTPALVDDLVDKQSNAFAQTHFSEEVETEMIKIGYRNEANFCRLIRRWYEAEDIPAIDINDRIDRWLQLRDYLLKDVDFGCFPPPTQYIKGWSVVSFEGFISGIESKLQLYGMCGGSSYCVRTASSLPAETCVGIIQDMNVNNTMSVKAKDIPRIMSSLAEVMTYKCNPERGFHMKTSRSSVYPHTEGEISLSKDKMRCIQDPGRKFDCLETIEPRNHTFDKTNRRRTKVRRKLGEITKDLDAPPKGQRPMRHTFYTCNETKLLSTVRAGYGEDYDEKAIKNDDE